MFDWHHRLSIGCVQHADIKCEMFLEGGRMATQVKCDECGKIVHVSQLVGGFPSGWLTVTLRHETGPDTDSDYCSRLCEIKAATKISGVHLTEFGPASEA